ncbi:hypothetical protein B0T17DRAFT_587879 [Bombardia bombarda]|uniref:F-box domain-containing protein n=1 Tax=Bombardia bombarda TaxID=252184 RepID=A0AA39XNJ0_9PEZI|nr:hypothetical protein B0T17DRAFT_587879 [Bombardia bombarda]
MQQGLIEVPNRDSCINTPSSSSSTSQHGFHHPPPSHPDDFSQLRSRSTSPDGVCASGVAPGSSINAAGDLGPRLGRLSVAESHATAAGGCQSTVAGQRISEYENARPRSTSGNRPRPAMGFKVIKRPGLPSDRVQLTDFPNELLTQILSHLHPDSHSSVTLVSKRFYALVTTPYAWRAAFLRYFPGQDALAAPTTASNRNWDHDSSDVIRSESRYFARLTSLATWRSEYLLRTRLLRSVTRGKPGSIGASARSSQSGKKASAVLTYNSKLPWMITNVHASFVGGKKGPRVIHGSADFGVTTVSDPTTGRVEKWGLDDPFSFAQLEEMFPNMELYGLDEGPTAVPNVMDVSQPYGFVGGEGFPGGRVYYRATGELLGRYLGQDSAIIDMMADIPKIPQLLEAISSVWITKSSNVASMTQSMIGILAGSTLGVVTSYGLGFDFSGRRYSNGDMTARWVLSPGVPIIDIKVDDSYSQRRKALNRVWAVALNALGEVYYLTETPTPPLVRAKGEDAIKDAWHTGRTAYWHLIESTRRTAQPDEYDKNAVRGAYSPRSSANSMNLSKSQAIAEAQEIEKFLRHKPAHFRNVCQGWNMRRKLEVDFAGGDETGAGEGIFVITCGYEEDEPAAINRYTRNKIPEILSAPNNDVAPLEQSAAIGASIFGGAEPPIVSDAIDHSEGHNSTEVLPLSQPETPPLGSTTPELDIEEWRQTSFHFKNQANTTITASAIDIRSPRASTSKHATGEIPGRRARSLAVGTNHGSVIVWNMREGPSSVVNPMRVIQTESPEISSLALSALYLVHGGSDGLVQAWDPLASTLDPVRTLNSKSSGRIPRHILNANPALQNENYFAVGAIFLDPDPTALRGVLAFGTFLRFWTYSSTNQTPGRKRRLRHSDIHGRLASRRTGAVVSSYIAAEEAEHRHDEEHRSRELLRLRSRFGVGLGDLTEEEAIRYAEMVSEESFAQEEQRRWSASDTGSTADIGETASSADSTDTVTPEPSLSGAAGVGSSTNLLPPLQEEVEDDYEAQIQRAIRLSLMEGVNDAGQSPLGQSSGSGEFEFPVTVKQKKRGKGKKGKNSKGKEEPWSTSSPSVDTPVMQYGESSNQGLQFVQTPDLGVDADDDLALALRLSLEEEQARQNRVVREAAAAEGNRLGEFPALEVEGKGKGKGNWA